MKKGDAIMLCTCLTAIWSDTDENDVTVSVSYTHTLYDEGHNVANQNSRELVVFDRKLEGSHSLLIF